MDQDNSSDDASTSDTVSSRTRPPADNVDRDREERLLRDRVRKRQKKKRVQAEENDLKRQLSELENKLTVLRGESIVRRGLTDRRRLQSNLVFEFEKAMLYQGLIVTLAPDRVVVMQRSLAQDEHVAGWFVFEASSPTTSVMQGYTQVSLQSTPQNAAQVYTAFMTRSTRSNAILNHLLDKLNVVVAYN
ncbi:hypothetical protein DYB37_002184 [Aphanomyces astaci]|uniref:Uncharacterized protein n=1 Tax=Aphanomyces astaci TaxID=112090 RepID=A0A3L6W027_APHAT|nr:hypothetical protein DYB35_001446 [Aphanomyces astaci]RHZ18668.1 hypothetical protein DYB37_002184 [Aphanomyces astaci]RLO14094.1 hypothetical protein DYB28_003111 [Aphanomyces astaci]